VEKVTLLFNVLKASQLIAKEPCAITVASEVVEQQPDSNVTEEALWEQRIKERQATLAELEQQIKDLQEEAKQIVFAAEQNAAKVIEQAQQEAETIREKAQAAGFEQGKQEGYQQGRMEAAELITEAQATLTRAEEEAAALMATVEPEIIELIIAVAAKIIRREIEIDPQIVSNLVKESLRKANSLDEVIIRVNLHDYATVNNIRQELLAMRPEIKELIITEDPRVEPGSCIIETLLDTIDARVDKQLNEVKKAFMDVMRFGENSAQAQSG